MEDFFKVGIIVSTHGLKGEVKVYPTTDDVRRFKRLKRVHLSMERVHSMEKVHSTEEEASEGVPRSTDISLEIESVKFFKQFAILKFRGIDSIEDAQRYRKASLLVPRSDAVRLEKDEYFVADLIGLTVRNEDGAEIGTLRDVMETGANDVYVIALSDGRELLLPAIRQCVLEVDLEAGFVRVHILEGLLDEPL